ncbi:Os06g0574700 [Oryza sativa Japonica Group]|uniref:Os06g0574700 protein n=2 Tax=Oryza sativa subsp. japonica TaxID=39947 RepID=B9FTV7_ORYSJ|nr:hypothetical protein OsJ_21772 [Oryza sativa Japonica Group]KAB8102882.1 hypothetical protein EE612_034952 [Oryza sativa]BAS98344.1 Os06g0574700 [Oryza sativa Japonica Group]
MLCPLLSVSKKSAMEMLFVVLQLGPYLGPRGCEWGNEDLDTFTPSGSLRYMVPVLPKLLSVTPPRRTDFG